MRNRVTRLALAVAVTVGLAVPASMGQVSVAYAQGHPGKQGQFGKQDLSQRGKKPGETCENLDRDSQAYRDCVEKLAEGTKSGHGPSGQHGKGKHGAE